MADADARYMAILRIGHDTSMRGEGLSLRDALARAEYTACRRHFGPEELRSIIAAHPSLVEEWLAYSEDKRLTDGWYVLRDGELGQVLKPASRLRYASIQEAVAEFVVRELDFWSGLGATV